MFVLEEYEHAKARGAAILAELCGYGSTCEAFHRVRLMECGEEPARAIGLAMEQAGNRPENVDYVNLHGTSTQINDRIETRALKLALGEDRARQVPMSALKSQIGHPQGACGAAGVAATLVIWKILTKIAILIRCHSQGEEPRSSTQCVIALPLDQKTQLWC